MGKVYPCIEVDLSKLTYNVKQILALCSKKHIEVASVTKVFCAKIPIVKALIRGGITQVADSRILNLKNLEQLNCKNCSLEFL